MTAPPIGIRHQESGIRPEGLPRRAPFLIAGALFAALFGWQSCLVLLGETAHPRASWMDDDYPLETGLTWVYKAPMGLQVVRRVTGPTHLHWESNFRHPWHVMQYELPILGRKILYMRRDSTDVEAHTGMIKETSQLIMKFPMRPGDSWVINFPSQDLAECTVLEPEEITVLRKRVKASKLRVVRTNRKSGKKTTDYEWYVRGIGLARMEVTFGIKAVFELERFEHAK